LQKSQSVQTSQIRLCARRRRSGFSAAGRPEGNDCTGPETRVGSGDVRWPRRRPTCWPTPNTDARSQVRGSRGPVVPPRHDITLAVAPVRDWARDAHLGATTPMARMRLVAVGGEWHSRGRFPSHGRRSVAIVDENAVFDQSDSRRAVGVAIATRRKQQPALTGSVLLLIVQGERGGRAARALATSRRQSSTAWRPRASLGSRTAPVTPTAAAWLCGRGGRYLLTGRNTPREFAAACGMDLDPDAGSRSGASQRKGVFRSGACRG